MKQERRTFRREFKVAQQGKVWVLDITYIRTLEG